MSKIGSYKNTTFSESQKFLVLDPATSSTSLVLGSDLVAYITPRIGSVFAETTRLSAENTDYKVGEIVQTSGATSIGDNFASVYLVVAGGDGDFPMLNGNDLLVLVGDDALRAQLISETASLGASLVSMEGGPTVEAAVSGKASLSDLASQTAGEGAALVSMEGGPTVEAAVVSIQNAIASLAGFTPVLTSDVDSITESASYYTDGTTANKPENEEGTLQHYQIDSNTATQQYTAFVNKYFFRVKVSSVWLDWQAVTSESIFTAGWPVITGDNLLAEINTSSAAGWTLENASTVLTSSANTLILDNNGGGLSGIANRDVSMATSGDYIVYAELSSESVSGAYNTVQIGGVGDGRALISLGYNWATGSADQNRISAAFRNGANTLVGIAGPVIDYSLGPVELALLYNNEFSTGTLFVKESGVWVGYGAVQANDPFRNKIRVYQGGNANASLTVHELFVAKPNIVSIGDSITEGATLYAPDYLEGLTNYASTYQGYANIYTNVRNNIIVNKGIGSQNSSQIDGRLASVLADATPAVVFLQASANDYGAGFTLSQRTVNIQNSITKIVNAGAKVALINAVYPNADAGGIFPAAPDYYRDWWEIELSSITNANIKIDWMEGSGILSGGTYMDTAFTQADGVHPTPTGYALLGNYIESLEP
jgi:lysophospholipase L1-like esterase